MPRRVYWPKRGERQTRTAARGRNKSFFIKGLQLLDEPVLMSLCGRAKLKLGEAAAVEAPGVRLQGISARSGDISYAFWAEIPMEVVPELIESLRELWVEAGCPGLKQVEGGVRTVVAGESDG